MSVSDISEQGFREAAFVKFDCRRQTKLLIKSGQLVKRPCDVCGELEVQAHHTDYDDPRHVRWLCHLCHHRVHRELARSGHFVTFRAFKFMTTADYATWLTKAQAATTIGVATKTIERLAQEGHLQQARWQRPTGGPALAVYNPDDVARIASERPLRRLSGIVVPAGAAPFQRPALIPSNGNGHHGDAPLTIAPAAPPAGEDLLRGLMGAILRAVSEKTSETPTLFLTIDQAAGEVGLTVPCVRRLIKARGIATVRDAAGVHIRRRDLEAL